MKISKIHIHKFNQFNDFELDLTYPKGHPKEGLPLDKVCFIGQSGTGKTSILNLINTVILNSDVPNTVNYPHKISKFKYGDSVRFEINKKSMNGDKTFITLPFTNSNDVAHKIFKKLIYLPAGLFTHVIQKKNLSEVNEEQEYYKIRNFRYFIFNKKSIEMLWDLAFHDVFEYQTKESTFRLKLTHRLEADEQIDFPSEIKKWKEANSNPLEKIANECLNPILKKFFLSVKTKVDDYENRKVIQIQSSKNEEVIPYEKLSSGTRQIIYTAFPIYSLLEKNSIVLIDEPENSLYPDIQKEIIEYYTSFDKEKESQFFFATHSPIIASSFEPWEIVELKFDSEGNIYRELYFDEKKGNHVDNYHTDARYLRWDQILTNVFDLLGEGNSKFRPKKMTEYTFLKNKILKLEKEGKLKSDDPKTIKLKREFEEAAKLLKWNS